MSSDFLTTTNAGLAAFQNNVYAMNDLVNYPWPEMAPVYSLIPHKNNEISQSIIWDVDLGSYDGISYGENIAQDSGTLSGAKANSTIFRMSQVLEFDRLSTMVMKNPRASGIDLIPTALKKAAQKRVESLEGIIVSGDGTGAIGTIAAGGVVDNGGGSYTVTLSEATWAYGWWSKRSMLNVGTSTDVFDVTDVDDVLHKVTMLRRSGGFKVPAPEDVIYQKNGRNNVPSGLKDMIEGVGTVHGVARQHGWQSLCVDWTNKSINLASLEELHMKTQMRCGSYPDMLLLSPRQYLRLRSMIRDNCIQTYDAFVSSTNSDGSAKTYEVANVQYIVLNGRRVKLAVHQHLAAGTGYFFNTGHLTLRSVGAGEFVPVAGGDNYLTYVGLIQGVDRYKALWMYYYGITTDKLCAHSGFKNAISTTPENLF